MSVIDRIMSHKSAQWVGQKIDELPNRSRFRALNSIRSLSWANKIYDAGLPIPACYCALHATEEAVAAFISCAKECGYGDDAKINIHDHQQKATISLMTQIIVNFLQKYSPAVALNEKDDLLVVRLTVDNQHTYDFASTRIIRFVDGDNNPVTDFYKDILGTFSDIGDLRKTVILGQEARNRIFYADKKGCPTGFNNPEQSLERECQVTLGLIWASIDINKNKDVKIPFISQALRTANLIITELKAKK